MPCLSQLRLEALQQPLHLGRLVVGRLLDENADSLYNGIGERLWT